MSKESETYQSFIKSNLNFYYALDSKTITLDENLTIEILLLYLKTKFNLLKSLNIEDIAVLEDIIINNNYYLKEGRLVYQTTIIGIEYLQEIAAKLRTFHPDDDKKIIPFPSREEVLETKEEKTYHSSKDNLLIIDFKNCGLSYQDMSTIFSNSEHLNPTTQKYVEQTKYNFNELMDQIFDALQSGNLNTLNKNTLQFLIGTLDIQACEYLYTHDSTCLDRLYIPNYQIAMSKQNTYDEESKQRQKDLTKAIEYLELTNNLLNTRNLPFANRLKLENRRFYLSRRVMTLTADNIEREGKQSVYNVDLVRNIIASIIANEVEVIRLHEIPKVKFFITNQDEVLFHCFINLSLYEDLIYKEGLAEEFTVQKKELK